MAVVALEKRMKKRDKEKEDVFVSSFIQSVILNSNNDAKTARTVKGHTEKLSKEKESEIFFKKKVSLKETEEEEENRVCSARGRRKKEEKVSLSLSLVYE